MSYESIKGKLGEPLGGGDKRWVSLTWQEMNKIRRESVNRIREIRRELAGLA